MNVLFLDVETTGLNPQTDNLLQVAAVPTVDGKVSDEKNWLNTWIKYPYYNVSNGVARDEKFIGNVHTSAKATNGRTRDVEDARRVLREYFKSQRKQYPTVVGGKNVGFDLSFLEVFTTKAEVDSWFSFRKVDIGNLFMLPTDKSVPGLQVCWERAGLTGAMDWHDALDDALACAKLWEVWYAARKV